jgi:hypothetical protein
LLILKAGAAKFESSSYSLHRRIDVMHVVVVVERVEKIHDLLARGGVHFAEFFGDVAHLRRDDVPARRLQRLGNVVEVFDFGEKTRALLSGGNFGGFERLDLLRAGFNRIGFRVAVRVRVRGLDDAEVVEEKRDAAGLAHRTGLEQIADLRRGAVAIVRQAFHDDGNFVRREAFIDDRFINHLFVREARALFDGALDGVLRDGRFLGLLDGDKQARVEVGVGAAEFGRDHDFADELDDHLAFFVRVDFAPGLLPLCAHKFVVSGEANILPDSSQRIVNPGIVPFNCNRWGERPREPNNRKFQPARLAGMLAPPNGKLSRYPLRRRLVICRACFNLAAQYNLKNVNTADSSLTAAISESRERKIVLLLCVLAAIHVFIFSAAFPFFNNVDEQAHFDLVVKYSHGQIPRRLDFLSKESLQYIAVFTSQEFLASETDFPGGQVPPPIWLLPPDKTAAVLQYREAGWQNINLEASQPPLYYSLAGLWWRLENLCGLAGGSALYGLRFLNLLLIAGLVWLGYLAAWLVFPENKFARLGVPALIAFIPQTAFYGIQNDTLSPLTFGAAFILLVKFSRAETPRVKLGVAAGLALTATFLTKISNLPLLAVSALAVLFIAWHRWQGEKLRASLPALAALGLCALPPMAAWFAWCKYNFGDFTGTAAKIQFLGWTHKPFAEWWHHPIFTVQGFWTFVSGLLSTFWQGEFMWHRQPLTLPSVNLVYAMLSVGLLALALVNLLSSSRPDTAAQRQVLWFGICCFVAAVAFLGFLSVIYDFHNCFYPSREHPYFTSGRLMLGALIPFMLLFVYGIDRAFEKFGNIVKFIALAAMILFMFISEITTDWPALFSEYNWFHM